MQRGELGLAHIERRSQDSCIETALEGVLRFVRNLWRSLSSRLSLCKFRLRGQTCSRATVKCDDVKSACESDSQAFDLVVEAMQLVLVKHGRKSRQMCRSHHGAREILEETVEAVKVMSQERILDRIVEQFIQERMVERIMEEIIVVVQSIPPERVQCTVDQCVDVPVRQIQEQTVLGVCSNGQFVPQDLD